MIAVAGVLTVIYRSLWMVLAMAAVVGLFVVMMRRQPAWRFDEQGIHAARGLVVPWSHASRVERRRTGLLRPEVLVLDPPFKIVGLGAITFVPLGALTPEWRNTDIGEAIDRWGPGTS